MAASIASITAKRATIVIPIDPSDPDSDTVSVTYKPKAYTRQMEREMNALTPESENQLAGAAYTIGVFQRMVTKWDLKYSADDADPIPLTDEGLETVPVEILTGILEAIGNDQKPDPKAEKR